MSLWNSLSQWIRRPGARRGGGRRGFGRGRPRPYRPRLEMLEDRNLLSTFTVDHLADDLVGSGLNGSLRYCLAQATSGNDTITFGVTGTLNLTGALPDLAHSISLQGPGANNLTVRRDTGGYYRIFTVDSGTTVSISGLTISNGGGGGILNSGMLTLNDTTISGNESLDRGGGIDNDFPGTLTMNNVIVRGNSAGYYGGGIYNRGTLTANNATVSLNRVVTDLADPHYVSGGGICNDFGGTVTLTNSTVSGNVALGYDDYSNADGGGISNMGTLTVTNATVSGNGAGGGYLIPPKGGGIYNYYLGGTLTLINVTVSLNNSGAAGGIWAEGTVHARNTVIAGNTAPAATDLAGNLGSQGHNLIGNTQGGSGFDPTDLLNVDPMLGPLQDNGGPTLTHALLAGSPALNAGDPAQLGAADQRGVVRAGGVNIGAYQASASTFVVTVSGTVASGMPFDVTVQAVDIFGQVAFGYRGTVTFSVTDPDPAVVLPPDYTFTPDDPGTHTFTGGFTLITPGSWTLSVADLANGLSIDVTLTVNP
jgi:hypothetical protein